MLLAPKQGSGYNSTRRLPTKLLGKNVSGYVSPLPSTIAQYSWVLNLGSKGAILGVTPRVSLLEVGRLITQTSGSEFPLTRPSTTPPPASLSFSLEKIRFLNSFLVAAAKQSKTEQNKTLPVRLRGHVGKSAWDLGLFLAAVDASGKGRVRKDLSGCGNSREGKCVHKELKQN